LRDKELPLTHVLLYPDNSVSLLQLIFNLIMNKVDTYLHTYLPTHPTK